MTPLLSLWHGRDRTQGSDGPDGGHTSSHGSAGDPPGGEARARPAGSSPAFIRSPEFLARLVGFLVLFVVLAVLARVLDRTFAGFYEDLSALAIGLPGATGPLLSAFVITVAVLIVIIAAVVAHIAAGWRFVIVVVLGAAVAFAAVGGALLAAVDRDWMPDSAPGVLAFTAAAVATLVVQREQLRASVLRIGWWGLVPASVVSSIWTHVPPVVELLAIVGAAVLAAIVALIVGTPSRAPSAEVVAAGLEHIGLRVAYVAREQVDARASVPWRARLATGREVFVKTHSSEERSADLLFRVWRALRLRRSNDELPETTLRRAVEHEAFVATRAAAVGVRTPRLVGLGRLEDGVFAAYECIEGRTFEDLGDEVAPAALRAAWSMGQSLHRAGIAHRDLRAANLLVDGDGDVWIVDFGIAEIAASDQQLRHDVVELVASTAAVVGVRTAVNAAIEVMGPEPLIDALPYVQPAAVCTATRKALGKSGFEELRRSLIEATGAPEPDEPHLERVRPKTLITIVALGIALWVLLPQVTQKGDLWTRVTQANLGWVALGLAVAATTYVAATFSLLGAVPIRVPFLPTFGAQVASSFTNRITPASVGGLALNARYLAKSGTGTATAAAAVGVSATAGAVMHLVLSIFAVAWAGSSGGGTISSPDGRTLLITGAVIFGAIGAGLAIPGLRHFLVAKLKRPVQQSVRAMNQVAHQPRKLVMLFAGSAMVTIGNIAALVIALNAFGVGPAVSAIAVVYLAGAAVGSAAPTPGGLGAIEAALVAGLTATAVPEDAALAAVLLFRLTTFWLPILPGWIAFVILQRKNYL